jgi:hypothetical protein
MSRTVLEDLLRDYVESSGGAWDEVEPQVYDLLLPASPSESRFDSQQMLRVAFDPEAIPEHPGAQLAGFGTPLVDRLLDDAINRGRFSRLYFLGLNLNPRDLPTLARRAIALADGLELTIGALRALYFPQAFFWFQATFASDQKEREIVPVAIDLHYGRQVRHRDKLLDQHRLSELEPVVLPEVRHSSLAAAYPLARDEVARTLTTLAHIRDRDNKDHLGRQVERMKRYYADMRSEIDAAPLRGKDAAEVQAQRDSRKIGLEREEKLRIAELLQKSALRVDVQRLATVVIQQPKILLKGELSIPKKPPLPLQLVWDPLLEALEAASCPSCQAPTFKLGHNRLRGIVCPGCERDE